MIWGGWGGGERRRQHDASDILRIALAFPVPAGHMQDLITPDHDGHGRFIIFAVCRCNHYRGVTLCLERKKKKKNSRLPGQTSQM